jgi:hypothetical protein
LASIAATAITSAVVLIGAVVHLTLDVVRRPTVFTERCLSSGLAGLEIPGSFLDCLGDLRGKQVGEPGFTLHIPERFGDGVGHAKERPLGHHAGDDEQRHQRPESRARAGRGSSSREVSRWRSLPALDLKLSRSESRVMTTPLPMGIAVRAEANGSRDTLEGLRKVGEKVADLSAIGSHLLDGRGEKARCVVGESGVSVGAPRRHTSSCTRRRRPVLRVVCPAR